ncbi:hypothetical protein ACFSTI_11040 [Rhizorhabdus histidinilytica]
MRGEDLFLEGERHRPLDLVGQHHAGGDGVGAHPSLPQRLAMWRTSAFTAALVIA